MTGHELVCAISDKITEVNGNPITIVALAPVSGAIILAGWVMGDVQLALLSVTSFLSVQASLMGCITTFRLRKQDGEVE